MEYQPRKISEGQSVSLEKKWQSYWVDNQIYSTSNDATRPKYYVLDMFPYPSGAGLHVGHPLGYIASDIFARYKRLSGFNVLHPMGYDAFGLPAEQYAIQTGVHPADSTEKNIQRYREQLDNLGFCYDWNREVRTSDADYYKWTQWIFLQLFSHYFGKKQNKSVAIEGLISQFEAAGNTTVAAANTQENIFSATEWSAMTAKQKDDVLMNYRLAYRKTGFVNWCEAMGTVLANDEVKDGVSERGGHPVERRPMLQWSLRTTAYAERLLTDLENLDWSEALKSMQRNWIGRSEGASIFFEISDSQAVLEIFTTRPDTIFGVTFMVVAPEHPLLSQITTYSQKEEVAKYVQYVKSRSDRDRQSEVKEVTGVFTGAYVVHPFNQKKIPVWIAEYVLLEYGTGAIMAVPSDDERDQIFAQKFDLPIIDVVDKSKYPNASLHDKLGTLINSDFLNGKEVVAAIQEMFQRLEAMKIGEKRVNYRLRDANYSRQRYWGEPIPILYDAHGVAHAVDVTNLPLLLPNLIDFKPAAGGKSPLSRATEWVNFSEGWTRETDTMPGFAGSSWYFLRYMDSSNDHAFASPEALNYWRDVDFYIGGAEHAVGHLLYARFWHKVLFDIGKVPTAEPFKRLINQGMIQGRSLFIHVTNNKIKRKLHIQIQLADDKDRLYERDFKKMILSDNRFEGIDYQQDIAWQTDEKGQQYAQLTSEVEKMSKSKYNVVNPDEVVEEYGADCFRLYEMFLGPIDQSKPWDMKGIDGCFRFLRKFWSLFFDKNEKFSVTNEEPTNEEYKVLHTAIKKITQDIERLSFNTCVSAYMVCTNDLRALNCNKQKILEPLVVLLAPFAPHIAEELWQKLGYKSTINNATFPICDEQYLVESSFIYPICINGKKRAELSFDAEANKEDIISASLNNENIKKWLDHKVPKNVVVVPKKMVNIVV